LSGAVPGLPWRHDPGSQGQGNAAGVDRNALTGHRKRLLATGSHQRIAIVTAREVVDRIGAIGTT
jgi:hypothetical protein